MKERNILGHLAVTDGMVAWHPHPRCPRGVVAFTGRLALALILVFVFAPLPRCQCVSTLEVTLHLVLIS
jgi:hypothetical protein